MYSPTTRVLTVLELLQSRAEISGPEIAARLEVDVRSVRRYVMMLRDMGIPVETERGRYGFYSLRPGFRLPPLMFSDDEILSIILGLMAVRKMGLAATLGIESASAKIERVLPDELRERVRAVQNTLVLNMHPSVIVSSDMSFTSSEHNILTLTDVIAQFTLAAHQRCRSSIVYRSGRGEETSRMIDSYGLVYHAGFWYAASYCHLRHDLRVFRLDRVVSIDVLDEHFERPPDIDLLGFVLNSMANTPGTWFIEVLLHATPERARETIPPQFATLEAVEGGMMMRCYVQDLDWLARFLVGLPFAFTVCQPPELRDALRQLGEKIIALSAQTCGNANP